MRLMRLIKVLHLIRGGLNVSLTPPCHGQLSQIIAAGSEATTLEKGQKVVPYAVISLTSASICFLSTKHYFVVLSFCL